MTRDLTASGLDKPMLARKYVVILDRDFAVEYLFDRSRAKGGQSMPDETWTWDEKLHPRVIVALGGPAADLAWCDRLETAPFDATVGKVLCVCAAMAIARELFIAHNENDPKAADALELLARWVDDPTEDRFARICSLIFGDDEPPDLGPESVGWWALRTATSSVGNYEAGWALSSACEAAQRTGLSSEQLRAIAEQAVMVRRRETV